MIYTHVYMFYISPYFCYVKFNAYSNNIYLLSNKISAKKTNAMAKPKQNYLNENN